VRRAATIAGVLGVAGAVAGLGVGWIASDELRPEPRPIVLDAAPEPSSAPASPAAQPAPAGGPRSLVAEDGISEADARRIERAARRAVPGTVLSVERDDGLFHADVRERSGGISEVLLDDRFRVVGVDIDD
jgi:hypothetical protein